MTERREDGQGPARRAAEGELERELGESNASALMSDEMLANAMAHGQAVDLDRLHEESLSAADEIEAAERRGRGASDG